MDVAAGGAAPPTQFLEIDRRRRPHFHCGRPLWEQLFVRILEILSFMAPVVSLSLPLSLTAVVADTSSMLGKQM